MIHGRLDPVTGRLSNIWDREPGPGDVPLVRMPTGDEPWAYDAANKLAISATPTEAERLDGVALPPRVRAALLIRASSLWAGLSAQRKARVMAIIDAHAQAVVDALTLDAR